jgi:hypothetical protein
VLLRDRSVGWLAEEGGHRVRLGAGERVGRARVVPCGVEARAQELADAHDDLLEDRLDFVVRWCIERLEADLSMLADEDTVRPV